MSVRAKFYVQSVEDYGQSKKVNMSPVYEGPLGENEENRRFTQASPSGALWITIDNPYASEQFAPGQQWYLDFNRADLPADA
jgi:hypothetical protein